MDIFNKRAARPMEIGRTEPAFDDAGFLYEIKLDGERCLAYVDKTGTELVNRRSNRVTARMPELTAIHRLVKGRCILDGELVVVRDGKPDFEEIKRRGAATNPLRIELLRKQSPVSYVVFDILYRDGAELTGIPLRERKQVLEEAVRENGQISISRYVEKEGEALFNTAVEHGLEGIVAKRADSLYHMGKRSGDWVKCKITRDDEYIVCGYICDAEYVASLVLGQYGASGEMVYKGHVTLALSSEDFAAVQRLPRRKKSPFAQPLPPGNTNVQWVAPRLVCTVQYMHIGAGGLMRHPVYKGLRADKTPQDVVENI